MTPFVHIRPELALAEMRSFVVRGYPGLPDGEYGLLEAYCTDPQCDCRRVMLSVLARRDAEEGRMAYLASISFAFDRDAAFAGPELDPLNPQSKYAEVLLQIVTRMLAEDPAYVARLESHYRMVKESTKASGGSKARGRQTRGGARPDVPAGKAEEAQTAGPARGRKAAGAGETVPTSMRPTFEAIVNIAEPFCREHLDEEYAQLSRKLAAALSRKRPSPLVRGKPQVWACAIVYALGSVNFLWDKSRTPHMRADELAGGFGVAKSTAANKARAIMDALKMGPFDPRWWRPSQMDENPVAWLIMVDRLMVDARNAPREIQEEAFRKGLIPYLPGRK